MALTNEEMTTEMTTKNPPPPTTAIAIKEKGGNGLSSFQIGLLVAFCILLTIVILMIVAFRIWLRTGFQNRVNETVIAAQNP